MKECDQLKSILSALKCLSYPSEDCTWFKIAQCAVFFGAIVFFQVSKHRESLFEPDLAIL